MDNSTYEAINEKMRSVQFRIDKYEQKLAAAEEAGHEGRQVKLLGLLSGLQQQINGLQEQINGLLEQETI